MAFLKTDYTTYGDDWTINYTSKTVTNNDSGTGNNLPSALGTADRVGTSLNFFRWLADTFASTSQMDDDYPIESQTPTVFVFKNGWTFGNANDFKYLEGGSMEDPAGSGTATADSLWANLYSIGSQTVGTQLYMIQDDAEVTPWWISGNIDILVLVKDNGTWIQSDDTGAVATDGGLWIYAREFGDTFDHNFTDLSGGGRNPIGINTAIDGSNASGELYVTVGSSSGTWTVGSFLSDDTTGATGKIRKVVGSDVYLDAVRGGTLTPANGCTEYTDRELQTAGDASATISSVTNVVAGYTDITDTFGTISRDLNNGAGATNYDVEIDCAARPMTEVYEWLKYLTRYGSVGATYTVNSDDGQEYRSASEGVYSEFKVAPFGTLAGTTFYGARGVWVTNYSAADFVLINAANDEQSPPNYQNVNVTHPSLVGCNIFVAEISGSSLIKNQYTISSVTSSTIVATAPIDINKTPQSGSLRVGDTVYTYTSYTGSTFTVVENPTGETGDFYVPLLDILADATTELSSNIIYNADFDVRTSVRKYGFKPYDVDTSFGQTGLTFSPILSTDPQAT